MRTRKLSPTLLGSVNPWRTGSLSVRPNEVWHVAGDADDLYMTISRRLCACAALHRHGLAAYGPPPLLWSQGPRIVAMTQFSY